MWFKNLLIYRFSRPLELSIEQLETKLADFTFSPCGSQDLSKFGWVKPLGKAGSELTHGIEQNILICAKKEEKVLPASIVKDMLQDKVEAIETEQGRGLKKKEKDALKEDIVQQLLPRAFPRSSQTFAWICPKLDLLIIDSSSAKKADDLIALLRKCIGSLPVTPLMLDTPADVTMTDWLDKGDLASGFILGDEAELRSALEHGGIIRCKEQDLSSDEIKHHLAADKFVTKLALDWNGSVSFLLGDDMSIKRLKFSDIVKEKNDDIPSEDYAAKFDADFALMTGELELFIPDLIAALGGEVTKD